MRLPTERALIAAIMAISLVTLGLQAFVLRPRLWPAGAGLDLSGDTVMATLAAPRPVAVIRPPDIGAVMGSHIEVMRIAPNGPAEHAGLHAGERVLRLADQIDLRSLQAN